ncbi:YdiU family protein [Paracoccus sp. 1_MG-2023]|uniref:protein adenylyltransferase SelO n=1 Tax=unclassified Paracoccus (in: a-proteobacteria) TaxID=2688777 RepID=UPI001C088EF7|nr:MULTISPECIES: YdiU family protein [unclassified Paracoccus (in: a-proteobacteria)]MBU2958811.1 YdiU family protein [Paracoccus sp. C2R09]MDO6667804.1 YdiU family protein [Paracoccus sp. 1_MG-2023]
MIHFDNSYARLPQGFFARIDPTPVSSPQLLALNEGLAERLGLDAGHLAGDGLGVLAGNAVPEGAEPIAQAYAGHQFGGFSPQLGDGRAVLLGEVIAPDGARFDLQLKGSGPTPFSRRGDGRAWMGPVLREYLVSEFMAAMGVPTTRALAAVSTGDLVFREQGGLPGAVLTRVAASHIRVGTFQYFAVRDDKTRLQHLTDHVIARHYPDCGDPLALLDAVVERQARTIADWMSLGFIHGVMNTDNMAISGETIDYGPCAFMDGYHPDTVFSSIDRQGRYAWAQQPQIAVWNLAQFATCLIPLMGDEETAVEAATKAVHRFAPLYQQAWLERFGAKLGIDGTAHQALVERLLTLMAVERADFTRVFDALTHGDARDEFMDRKGFDAWAAQWQALSPDRARMQRANPRRIPRNHRIEAAIASAVAGDMDPFRRLLDACTHPFDDRAEWADLAVAPTKTEAVHNTFCGT